MIGDEESGFSAYDLIHSGLQDMDRSRQGLERLRRAGLKDPALRCILGSLASACDPDAALNALVPIVESWPGQAGGHGFLDCTGGGEVRATSRLIRVLGASEAMGRLMRSRPDLVRAAACDPDSLLLLTREERVSRILRAVVDASDGSGGRSPLAARSDALRAEYRLQLAALMAWDLEQADPVRVQPRVSAILSDMADAALTGALDIAMEETGGSASCRFAVIGMGKLGARELNYVSDVDLIYVVEPPQEGDGEDPGPEGPARDPVQVGTRVAILLQRVCQSVMTGSLEPPLWQVDTALRPEGRDGPLVRRLESHRDYYRSWAESWEFQALLKARPVAGDRVLGREYHRMAQDFVWSASQRRNFVYDCQEMRGRVERMIPERYRDREIKLGRGGLRDVEFTVQMLQLVHGRTDPSLRVTSTLEALAALAAGGYISEKHQTALAADYRFERVLEHRLQMWQLKRTHLFPDLGERSAGGLDATRSLSLPRLEANRDLKRLARAFDMHVDEMVATYDRVRRQVRSLHQAIYFRPMLPINAQLDDEEVSLRPQAARERFASIGFADPDAAVRHVQALTVGVTRSAKINRILLPAVLGWLGEGQDPDMGLLGWRNLEERFGSKSAYLGFLRDSTSAARRLCHVLSNSRYLGAALNKSVESVTWLGDDADLRPRDLPSLRSRCDSYRDRHADQAGEFASALRGMRRQEIERIGLGWMSGVIDQEQCLRGMSDVYDAAVGAALDWAVGRHTTLAGLDGPPAAMTVIAMGRYGGREVNFNSDADAILVYRPARGADDATAGRFARDVVTDLRAVLSGPLTLEPKIDLDLDLRPEGRQGPLVRSLDSCREYYFNWSQVWEHQALLRARPAAGDPDLARDFLKEVADPLRYPSNPPDGEAVSRIRKLKARMEAERLPRGVRRDRHLKLGRGGLSDVEWTVQLLQLQHACDLPCLRTTSTLQALQGLEEAGLVGEEDARVLERSWVLCTSARNGNYLWSGRATQADILPDDGFVLGGIAVYLGYPAHRGQEFANELLGAMRRCREVMDRLFYGL